MLLLHVVATSALHPYLNLRATGLSVVHSNPVAPAVLMMAKKAKKGGGGTKGGTVQVVLNAPVKGVGKKGEVVSVRVAGHSRECDARGDGEMRSGVTRRAL